MGLILIITFIKTITSSTSLKLNPLSKTTLKVLNINGYLYLKELLSNPSKKIQIFIDSSNNLNKQFNQNEKIVR